MNAKRNDRKERADARERFLVDALQYAGHFFSRAGNKGVAPGNRNALMFAAAIAAGSWSPDSAPDHELREARAAIDALEMLLEPLVTAWDAADLRLSEVETRRGKRERAPSGDEAACKKLN